MTYAAKLIKVDLSSRSFAIVEIEPHILAHYLGGRGLGVRLLAEYEKHLLAPFDPQSAFVFAAGPLTGLGAISAWRSALVAISPKTNTIFDSSSGGRCGVRLRQAGYMALMVEGEAQCPTVLKITSEGAEFIDAGELWGKGIRDAQASLKENFGADASSLVIGPAGENLSLIASVAQGDRFFGRGGLGALLGKKKLKAVLIEGKGKLAPADPEGFAFVENECKKLMEAQPITARGLPQFGTPVMMNVIDTAGVLPVSNYRGAGFAGAQKISGEAIKREILSGRRGCPGCSIICGRKVTVDGEEMEGPEFETLWSFGANLGIDDLAGISRLNRIANDLGLDTVSAGSAIACARELYDAGKLPEDPTAEGVAGIAELLEEMAFGRGLGRKLMHGSDLMAGEAGLGGAAMSVKGLELPAYDPRGCQGQGLAYATSNRGGCHLRSYMIAPEILATPKLIDRFATSGKAGLVIVSQNLNAAVDSLAMCRFTSFALKDDYYARLVSAATGLAIDSQGFMTLGERIYNLERLINNARGFGRKDDTLPRRLLEDALESGPTKGKVVELATMLAEYYRFRGWDEEGRPTERKLKELGL